MDGVAQAYTVAGLLIAAGGAIMIFSPALGAFSIVIGLVVAWHGVRLSNQKGAVRQLLYHAEWATHHLLNAAVSDPESFPSLRDSEADWIERVVKTMRAAEYAQSEISRFRVLVSYPVRGLDGMSDEHRRFREEVNERIERLRGSVRRIEGGK